MREVYVEVPGIPVPQGSMRAFVNGAGQPYLVHSNKALKPWRDDVAKAISEKFKGFFLYGAISAHLTFVLPKPKSATRSRPHVKPDLDKLIRATLDAITASGIVYDDAQVCQLNSCKVYCREGESPQLKLFLKELGD